MSVHVAMAHLRARCLARSASTAFSTRTVRSLLSAAGRRLTAPAAGQSMRERSRAELGAQLLPRQHRHCYAAVLHRGLIAGETNRPQS